MNFTKPELSAILAGLRLLQEAIEINEVSERINGIFTNGGQGDPLSLGDLDDLCNTLNFDQGVVDTL